MPKTMLIDATHPEETRVAVVDGQRLVEYDYESKVRKQLKGSVFLAKVTRVEPSLQAAFVNFGGNRHGFLPFSEIHPDYFRIPVADREALLAAQMAELEEHDNELEQQEAAIEQLAAEGETRESSEEDEEDDEDEIEAIVEVGGEDQPLIDEEDEDDVSVERADDKSEEEPEEENNYRAPIAMSAQADILQGPAVEEESEDGHFDEDPEEDEENEEDFNASSDEEREGGDARESEDGQADDLSANENGENTDGAAQGNRERGGRDRNRGRGRGRGRGRNGQGGSRRHGGADRDDRSVDSLGGDGVDGDRPFRFNMRKSYKIQEVIKRGQIMLIQVSKEERGNKGAAVTTYLSMPGRYCVLMPNSPRGGGVSRKIASFKDRKRMKEMLTDLSVPDGMSVILRTAGVTRTKVEIKRDLDYLTRLWNTIREHTLQSTAPALIYEEGNLIKRAIRDLYSRDIEDVYVSGDEGYKAAKDFMKMLMPSHAKKVQEYKNDRVPMFHKFGVENQIFDMGEPVVNLKSGGYLVINPTEALVSVDVNTGRATKERHIEDTALKTNLEAADEVARQLRLRDLGGLVVIDFIDMEDRRNNRKVEQRLRDALSSDRARIQVGRISSFGLLELSRQRLNPSLAEAQQEVCAHCAGTGRVKTLDFSAISIIRALEVEGIKGKANEITLTMATSVALYIMNNKRRLLNDLENRYGFNVMIETDDTMSTSHYKLETATRAAAPKISEGIRSVAIEDDEDDVTEDDSEGEASESEERSSQNNNADRSERGEGDKRRRRGRRGGRGRGRDRDRTEGNREEGEAGDDSRGNLMADEFEGDDDIGNRAERDPEEGRDQNRGNREPREGGERNRRRRGGRGRGRDRDRAERPSIENGEEPQPRERDLREGRPQNNDAPTPQAAQPVQAVRASNAPSNDVHVSEPPAPRAYETVNEAPEKKKKGWWNKLVE